MCIRDSRLSFAMEWSVVLLVVARRRHHFISVMHRVDVCMGMGIPIPRGFPWDSHGNGSSFGLLNGMGTGKKIAYFIGEK